jgi:Flp pilus assembly pilin Flp
MTNLLRSFAQDDAGFVVSSELVLVATIGVLAMIVGLNEIAHNVSQELEDVGSAFGSINQSFRYSLPSSHCKARMSGSCYRDSVDDCDDDCDLQLVHPQGEKSQG